ncbi:MAG: CoA-binding protein [Planctomycetales bacterium]|nr:CoA-binding protein [Planctomycetales bacterium]
MSPPTAAILGASADHQKFGNKSLRAHRHAGYEVFPVNPRGGTIEGLEVFTSILEVPGDAPLDRVSIYLPPPLCLQALPDIAKRGAHEVWLNPGTSSPEILELGEQLGLTLINACSIVDLGLSPADFP